jgi:hypothetical protein
MGRTLSYVGGVSRVGVLESARNLDLVAGNSTASTRNADLGAADVELRFLMSVPVYLRRIRYESLT